MPIELECKIPIRSRAEYSERLGELGAAHEGDVHEQNFVFDTRHVYGPDQHFLLRLRMHDEHGDATLTVKRPTRGESGFKRVEETEILCDSAENALHMLKLLGFQVEWFYEKRRETWRFGGCEIALDELPEIGCFIEVEGPDEAHIEQVLAALGLDPAAHIQENYRRIFHAHRTDRGQPFDDMRFDRNGAPRDRSAVQEG